MFRSGVSASGSWEQDGSNGSDVGWMGVCGLSRK